MDQYLVELLCRRGHSLHPDSRVGVRHRRDRAVDAQSLTVVWMPGTSASSDGQRVYRTVRFAAWRAAPGNLPVPLDLFEKSCRRMGCVGVAATSQRFERAEIFAATH